MDSSSPFELGNNKDLAGIISSRLHFCLYDNVLTTHPPQPNSLENHWIYVELQFKCGNVEGQDWDAFC